jgi:GntR family transcriptional regulator
MAQQTDSAPLVDLPLSPDEARRARLIDFSTDRSAELPVGVQLVWRIRGMVALGALRPGDRLPSVRELAGFSGINVNTARAAYATLEDEGVLNSEHGRGTFVADAVAGLRETEAIAARALEDAREAGIGADDLISAIYAASTSGNLPPAPFPDVDPTSDDAGLRRELRGQIAWLESELGAYAWQERLPPPPGGPLTAAPLGRVADVETLARTRAGLIDRLARLRGEAERRGEAQHEARRHVTEMVSDPGRHSWEIVTAEEAGDDGGREWRVVPRFGPLGAIMGWWRVKVTEPRRAKGAGGGQSNR